MVWLLVVKVFVVWFCVVFWLVSLVVWWVGVCYVLLDLFNWIGYWLYLDNDVRVFVGFVLVDVGCVMWWRLLCVRLFGVLGYWFLVYWYVCVCWLVDVVVWWVGCCNKCFWRIGWGFGWFGDVIWDCLYWMSGCWYCLCWMIGWWLSSDVLCVGCLKLLVLGWGCWLVVWGVDFVEVFWEYCWFVFVLWCLVGSWLWFWVVFCWCWNMVIIWGLLWCLFYYSC